MYLYLSVLLPFAYINRFTLLIKLLLSYLKINLKLTDLLLTLYNLQTITLVQTDYYSGSDRLVLWFRQTSTLVQTDYYSGSDRLLLWFSQSYIPALLPRQLRCLEETA